jgi:hypothetical protein
MPALLTKRGHFLSKGQFSENIRSYLMLVRLLFTMGVLWGVVKLTMWAAIPDSFAHTPVLGQAFLQSDVPARLKDLSVLHFTVDCGAWSKKTHATFYFVSEEGRAPLKVDSNRDCEGSGTLFAWSSHGTFVSKENYKPELVHSEITAMLEQSKLTKNEGNRFNVELAKKFEGQYANLALSHVATSVFLHCEEKGRPYEAIYYLNGGRHKVVKDLKTTCAGAHQNFTVRAIRSEAAAAKDISLTVHEYNKVDPQVAFAAYGEFLGDGPIKNAL